MLFSETGPFHELYCRIGIAIRKISLRELFKVRNNESKHPARPQILVSVSYGCSKVVERQVFQYVGAINALALVSGNGQALHYVSVSYITWKTLGISLTKAAQQWKPLEPQRGTTVKVQPSFWCAPAASVLHVVTVLHRSDLRLASSDGSEGMLSGLSIAMACDAFGCGSSPPEFAAVLSRCHGIGRCERNKRPCCPTAVSPTPMQLLGNAKRHEVLYS